MQLFRNLSVVMLALAPGCLSSAPDTATIQVEANDGGLNLEFIRWDPNHGLGAMHATVNGVALAAPSETAGHVAAPLDRNDESYGPTARFQIPTSDLAGHALDITVIEDNQSFHLVVPDFGSPRAVGVQTALDQPLHPGESIDAASGIMADGLTASIVFTNPAGVRCSSATSDVESRDGLAHVLVDSLLVDPGFWFCDTVAPGTLVDATMAIEVDIDPAATCEGPDGLTCYVAPLSVTATYPVKVQL